MTEEDFNKYFLYSLLDFTLTEIRFDSRPGEDQKLDKEKIWRLTHFLIELPHELYRGSIENSTGYYTQLVNKYDAYSKRVKIYNWFLETKKVRYSFFCRKYNIKPDSIIFLHSDGLFLR